MAQSVDFEIITGPPASGKTEAICRRALALSESGKQAIVVVPATEKLALQDRFDDASALDSRQIWVGSPSEFSLLCFDRSALLTVASSAARANLGTRLGHRLVAGFSVRRVLLASVLGIADGSTALADALEQLGNAFRFASSLSAIAEAGRSLDQASHEPVSLEDWVRDLFEFARASSNRQSGYASASERIAALAKAYDDRQLIDREWLLTLARSCRATKQLGRIHLLVDDYDHMSSLEIDLIGSVLAKSSAASVESATLARGNYVRNPAEDHAWAAARQRLEDRREFAFLELPGLRQASPNSHVCVRGSHLVGPTIVGLAHRLVSEGVTEDEILVVAPDGSVAELADEIFAAAHLTGLRFEARMPIAKDRLGRLFIQALRAIVHREPWPGVVPALNEPNLDNGVLLSHCCELLSTSAARRSDFASKVSFAAVVALGEKLREAERFGLNQGEVLDYSSSATFQCKSAQPTSARSQVSGAAIAILSDSEVIGRSAEHVIVCGFEEGTRPAFSVSSRLPSAQISGDYFQKHSALIGETNWSENASEKSKVEYLWARSTVETFSISAPRPGVLTSRYVEGIPIAQTVSLRPDQTVGGSDAAQRQAWIEPTSSTTDFWQSRDLSASASSLDTFLNCPLEYTFKYVLGVTTPSGVSAMVGTMTHEVLERFFAQEPQDRTKESILAIFDTCWDDAAFDYLAQAVEHRSSMLAMFDYVVEQVELENPEILALEHAFKIEVGGYIISGKIDRIDRIRTVDLGVADLPAEMRVIDYKTGNWKGSSVAEQSLQLGVYYLAALQDETLQRLGRPTELKLAFLKERRDAYQRVDIETATRWTELIEATMARIAKGETEPSVEADCQYCSFQRVCPISEPGAVV